MIKNECRVCGSIKTSIKYHIDNYYFLKCKKCGLVFLSQNFSKDDIFNTYNIEKYLSQNYKYNLSKENDSNNSSYFSNLENKVKFAENKYKEVIEMIGHNNSVGKKFLDIGCAAGFFLSIIKKYGYDPYGVEISAEGSLFAKNFFDINIIAKDLLELSDSYNNYFDFISMFHVLEHLPDPNIYLKKVNQIMKPGGFLIVEVPNIKSIDSLFFKYLIRIIQPPHHLYAFNYRNLEYILKKNGFEVVAKNIYFSNVIGNFLKKTLGMLGVYGKIKTNNNTNIISKNELNYEKKINLISFSKFILKIIFPGMVMIVVCKKI